MIRRIQLALLNSLSPAAPVNSGDQSGRIAFLDGWRAVAVGLVVMAHTLSVYGIKVLPFGTLGVYLFFGISGYIITRLLLLERLRTGRIDLRAFYVRRIARIMPPLIIFVAAMVAFAPGPEIAWQAVRAVSFTCNLGFGGTSCVRIFEHTWSLAFEEQFYLVYPLILRRYAALVAAFPGRTLAPAVFRTGALHRTGWLSQDLAHHGPWRQLRRLRSEALGIA